jgi:DNA-binding CsgD family transcriptional regulator
MEIAGKIASGRSNKDVGREFSICERTVKHHLTNIFKKVGVSSRLELAVLLRDKVAPQLLVSNTLQLKGVEGHDDDSIERPHLYLVSEP